MLKIIYPTGISITYNDANFVTRESDGWKLQVNKDGDLRLVALVQNSAGATIEFVNSCKTEIIMKDLSDEQLCKELLKRMRDISGYGGAGSYLKEIKNKLKDYLASQRRWK